MYLSHIPSQQWGDFSINIMQALLERMGYSQPFLVYPHIITPLDKDGSTLSIHGRKLVRCTKVIGSVSSSLCSGLII